MIIPPVWLIGTGRLWEGSDPPRSFRIEQRNWEVTAQAWLLGPTLTAGLLQTSGFRASEKTYCFCNLLSWFILPASSLQTFWDIMSSYVMKDTPSVPIALSPNRWFSYLKLFLSKDRQVNSLSTPHLQNENWVGFFFQWQIARKQFHWQTCHFPKPARVSLISYKWDQK